MRITGYEFIKTEMPTVSHADLMIKMITHPCLSLIDPSHCRRDFYGHLLQAPTISSSPAQSEVIRVMLAWFLAWSESSPTGRYSYVVAMFVTCNANSASYHDEVVAVHHEGSTLRNRKAGSFQHQQSVINTISDDWEHTSVWRDIIASNE